ncbi:potassium channel family protein [Metabacillus sediminilitoris]|uniref:Potassium channel protein n=1 Tax=Metabacillus sediminilitoris TaxID=2567941 RepID=A0A4S4BSY9_9BACI|nr:potassium channel family protein [Metabacillus sediminilitoris]QGQ46387.1 potassium channel protein [Metabacillus sediminilitoris]THF77374.1 potassium channel protein [Metabacillus sediminilitoris]
MIFFRRFFLKVVKMNNWVLIFATLSLVFSSSYVIYFLEPETFITPFEGLWWTMTTIATVGYGDVSPKTVPGKIFAMCLYIVGIGLMTIFIGKVFDFLSIRKKLKEAGKLKISTENHIILINWTTKAAITLDELLKTFQNIQIVIIDETLEKTPVIQEQVEFVNGNPANIDVLHQANLLKSKSVMVFSPDGLMTASQADGLTLLIASTIEGIGKKHNHHIYTICEVANSKHIDAFVHANVEEFITANDTAAHLAARSILFNGSSEIIRQLTSHSGFDLYAIARKPEWHTYADASKALTAKGALLISNGNDLTIIQQLNDSIPDNATLFIICNYTTYQEIMT